MFNAIASSLTIAVAALTQAYEAPDGSKHVSHAFGKTYTSRANPEAVNQTPTWDEAEESPPVSPRRAIKLAGKMLRSTAKAPDGWKWEATNQRLFVRGNLCLWHVMYQAVPIEPEAGLLPPFHEITLIVLMDGTVVKPVVADEKGNERS
jgi:hypothetical protein